MNIYQRSSLLIIWTGAAGMACSPAEDDKGSMGDVLVDMTLSLTGIEPLERQCGDILIIPTPSRSLEEATEDNVPCEGGVEISDAWCAGLQLSNPVFVAAEVGSTSVMLDPLWMTWSPTDPDAETGEHTLQWRGTFVVTEWSADRHAFDLVDGSLCAKGADDDCEAAEGSMVFEGEFLTAEPAEFAKSKPVWQDLGTGNLLCNEGEDPTIHTGVLVE